MGSIGRSPTPGTLIGEKKVISASSVETTRAASRIRLLPQRLTRSGVELENQQSLCELVCSRVVCCIRRVRTELLFALAHVRDALDQERPIVGNFCACKC